MLWHSVTQSHFTSSQYIMISVFEHECDSFPAFVHIHTHKNHVCVSCPDALHFILGVTYPWLHGLLSSQGKLSHPGSRYGHAKHILILGWWFRPNSTLAWVSVELSSFFVTLSFEYCFARILGCHCRLSRNQIVLYQKHTQKHSSLELYEKVFHDLALLLYTLWHLDGFVIILDKKSSLLLPDTFVFTLWQISHLVISPQTSLLPCKLMLPC